MALDAFCPGTRRLARAGSLLVMKPSSLSPEKMAALA